MLESDSQRTPRKCAAVKVALMGKKYKRLHHNIDWDKAVPVIIREEWRKNVAREP